jgi:ribosome maturation factor RimP
LVDRAVLALQHRVERDVFAFRLDELLDAADAGGITLSYEEKQAVEGKKRKQLVKVVKRYAFSEVKYTKEYLDFK